MWGSFKREANSASFHNRCLDFGSARIVGEMRFKATWRFKPVSSARYTSPIPPLPRRARMENLPTVFPARSNGAGSPGLVRILGSAIGRDARPDTFWRYRWNWCGGRSAVHPFGRLEPIGAYYPRVKREAIENILSRRARQFPIALS